MSLSLVYAPTIREQLERLAHWSLMGRVPERCLPAILRELAPHLDAETALLRFLDLVEQVALDDAIQRGIAHWSEVVPDAEGAARDEQAADATRVHIELALDELTGGAS